MRPHRLALTAFGPFPNTVEVDLDALSSAGLFLLHGETGAGKTTLLDALGFALYGKVPGQRNAAKRLRSDHAGPRTPTSVTAEFSVGARRLRVTRSPEWQRPKLRGSGTTTSPAAVLLEEAAGDGWQTVSTRVGEADAEISRLLGMSAEQFFQVVLLPQGEFARFLRANAQERGELLERLFGTDRFRDVEKWLAELRRSTAEAVDRLRADAQRLTARIGQAAGLAGQDVPELGDLAWAAGLAQTCRSAAEQADRVRLRRQSELDAAQAELHRAQARAEQQRRRADALADQAALAELADEMAALQREVGAAERASRVEPLLAVADDAQRVLDQAAAATSRARAAAGELLPDRAACATEADFRQLAGAARQRIGRLEELRTVAGSLRAERDRAAGLQDDARQGRAARAAADAEIAALPGRRAAVGSQLREARAAAQECIRLDARAGVLRAAHADAVTARTLARQRDELDRRVLAAREAAVAARERAQDVREARFDGMQAELAVRLADGDPCPVCGSPDHPEPYLGTAPPVSPEEERQAVAAADRASAVVGELERELAVLSASLAGCTQRLAAAAVSGTGPDELAAEIDELSREGRRLGDLAAREHDLAAELEQLILLEQQLGVRSAQLAEQVSNAEQAAQAAEQRAGELAARLEEGLDGAPDLDAALARVTELADTCDLAATALAVLDQRRAEGQRAAARAAEAAAEAGFTAVEEARAAARPEQWRAAAGQRLADHRGELDRVERLLADPALDVALDPPVDTAAPERAHQDAAGAYDAATAAFGQLAGRADDVDDLVAPLAAVLDRLEPVRERAATVKSLADLAAGLGANTLKMTLSSFVLAARLEEVAEVASQRLTRMTGGRYTLVHTDATRGAGRSGLGLLVRDAWTGQDRDTATLSGGETFMASLALALGLADVVAAESGGGRLEALFVDEGFGSLDEDTLDEVMDVLDGLREGGRVVGVVSHVADMRARIPTQLRVRKVPTGSSVELVGV